MVYMTASGFEPSTLIIKSGSPVEFVNRDSLPHWPASDPHPSHALNPDFDPRRPVPPGESFIFRFDQLQSTVPYHDHLFPNKTGKIAVLSEKAYSQSPSQAYVKNTGEVDLENFDPSRLSEFSPADQYKFVGELIQKRGIDFAWNYLKSISLGEKVDHYLAHYVGVYIYEKYGINGASICDEAKSFGCYHAIMELFLSTHGLSRDNIYKVRDICFEKAAAEKGFQSCLHGLGHALLTSERYSLPDSLRDCDLLSNGEEKPCWLGVFMEHWLEAPNGVYSKDDPWYPCDTLPEKYKSVCVSRLPRALYARLGFNFQQVAEVCMGADDKNIEHLCLSGIAYGTSRKFWNKPEIIQKRCDSIEEERARTYCVTGAASQLVFWYYAKNPEPALALCNSLSEEFRDKCVKQVHVYAAKSLKLIEK